MPDRVHQIPAPIDSELALGLSPVPGSRVAMPIPRPSMLSRSWVTRATTTPASTAPQAISLSRIVRWSSAGVAGLRCGASSSPRLRGALGWSAGSPWEAMKWFLGGKGRVESLDATDGSEKAGKAKWLLSGFGVVRIGRGEQACEEGGE